MEWFGVANLCRAAKAYNSIKYGALLRHRRRLYRRELDALIEENGPLTGSPNVIRDGWALDTSKSLPHLDRLLEEADRYIDLHGGKPREKGPRGYIQDILRQNQLAVSPSFLDFALSSDLLTTVCRYLEFIPVLSDTVPPGVRLVESTIRGQLDDGVYRQSQLHHLDFHDSPLVYVIVLLRDVTVQSGPFTYLSASTSARAARALRYWQRKSPFRVTDERMSSVVDRDKEEHILACPRGTVLFMDSSRCFHFGSRDAVNTRYQMMYAFVSPCRTDFAEVYMQPRRFPKREGDSRLRRLALDKTLRA